MFKRNGTYYLAYAANDSGCSSPGYACIRYATASNPMGPWTHRGVVLDQVTSTTNHPAIVEFKGQWYMVYHNAAAPGGGNFRRSVTLDKLYWNADGTMQKVVQTTGPIGGGGGGRPAPHRHQPGPRRHRLDVVRLRVGDTRRDQGRLRPDELRRPQPRRLRQLEPPGHRVDRIPVAHRTLDQQGGDLLVR